MSDKKCLHKLLDHPRLAMLLVVAGLAAVALRFAPKAMGMISGDMYFYLLEWLKVLQARGVEAYAEAFTDYAPLYTYILWPVSLLPETWWIYAIKSVSIIGDVALAATVYAIVRHVCDIGSAVFKRNVGLAAAVAVLWYPSVWMNSALWGQCDVFWVTCCMLSLLWLLRDKPIGAMIWYGLAISLKQQAIFFSPVIFMLLLSRKVKLWQILVIPGVYVLTCLPCVIAGRSPISVLTVYIMQGGRYNQWSLNAASVWQFVTDLPYSATVIVIVLISAVLFTAWLCYWLSKRYMAMQRGHQIKLLLVLAAFCGVFHPFILPGMHERYMYLGDIATCVAAFSFLTDKRLRVAALLTESASTMAVGGVTALFDYNGWPFTVATAVAAIALFFAAICLGDFAKG